MSKPQNFVIAGPKVYTENGVLTDTALVIDAGQIRQIAPIASEGMHDDNTVLRFPASYHLIPGFIDMHTHGVAGFDVMDASHEALAAIAKTLAAEGTTAFLATTMTAPEKQIENALIAVRDFKRDNTGGAEVLGVHLEGPFIAAAKMGAQPGNLIMQPNIALVEQWQSLSEDVIRLVTLAPEQPRSEELITYLSERGVIVSLGHTNASFAESRRAIESGCTHATHLFNAMSGIHHREPGAVTAALLSDKVNVELILDGVHLHPAIVELVMKVKGINRIILITDSMRAKCMNDGCYELGGQEVHVKNGEAKLADGTLAGSVLKMSSSIQNVLRFTGCELKDAIKMASVNPAKALGVFDRKGSIDVGKDADLVVLDDEMNVVLTLCRGEVVYSAEALVSQD